MKNFKNLFFKNNKELGSKKTTNDIDQYDEIGKLVKEGRNRKNLSIKELSVISKIPESSITAIENNTRHLIPKHPFIRSILLKLEEHLSLKENTLTELSGTEKDVSKKNKKNYVIRKFDFLNSWQGSFIYFLGLILMLFIINKYFVSNTSIIKIQIIEEDLMKK